MTRALAALIGLLIFTPASVQAQAPTPSAPPAGPGEVRGTVLAEGDNAPIAGATVTVRSKRDSSLVTGAVAKDDGSFRIQGLRPGTYYLRITQLGFSPRTTPDFSVTPEKPATTIEGISLPRVAIELSAVEVTTERSAVVIEPDRNSYQAKQVAPAATSASEVLQATPSVEVDGDGKVSLRGNENVAVQINGRPAPIRGEQLGAYLKGLPANIVERIEVVPTPSARHDPEGMAGIINIVLKDNVDLGLSGGFTAGGSPSQRYNASGNLGYQAGRFTIFSSYGFNSDQRNIVGINNRERHDALFNPLSFTEQDIAGDASAAGHNFNTNIDFKPNKRDVISNILSLNRRRSTDESIMGYTELDRDRSELDRYNRLRDAGVTGFVADYTLAFKRTIEARKHELGAELRLNRSSDDDVNTLWRQAIPTSAQTEGERNELDAVTRQAIAQVDYTRTLKARTKLETGYKGTSRWLDRHYDVFNDATGSGAWTLNGSMSNSFQFDEQVHAAYGVLSQGVGKFELQGGLRAERASRDFRLADDSYPYNYTSLFPSAVASYKVSDATQLKLAYSRRVRRPGTQELNPFPQFFDAQNVFIGNPNLNPEYTDALELGYTRTFKLGTMQVSPFYRRTTDIIRVEINAEDIVQGREVTSISFKNLATGNSWGTDVNGSLRLGPKFTGFGGFNIFKMVTDGGSQSALASGGVTWSARINGTTQLRDDLSLQAMYFYRAPMQQEGFKFSGMQFANIVMRKKINGDKSSVALRFTDPFNSQLFRVKVSNDNLTQFTERKFGARAMYLSYQMSFGQAPRVRQPTIQAPPEPQTGFAQ
ncbi:MAG: TonB-dependent receptor domain-containing protein [Gemmatimonadaceae bacterium]